MPREWLASLGEKADSISPFKMGGRNRLNSGRSRLNLDHIIADARTGLGRDLWIVIDLSDFSFAGAEDMADGNFGYRLNDPRLA